MTTRPAFALPAAAPLLVAALLAAALLAAALLAGCNTGGAASGEGLVEATRRIERSATPGQRMMIFDTYKGDVALQGTAANEADLTFAKHARAETREAARDLLGRIRIEEDGGEEEFVYRLGSVASGRTSVDVRGRIPQSTRLRLHLQSGEVALSGLQGPLDVSNENGDIRIAGAARTTRAETRNGSIRLGMRRVPPEAVVRLRTANGDLVVTLPASTSAMVTARTDAGEIEVRGGLRFAARALNPNGAGARFKGRLGEEGTAEINLRAENGDIILRQGTVRQLAGIDSLLEGSGGGAAAAAPRRAAATRDTAATTRDTAITTRDTAAIMRDTAVTRDTAAIMRDTAAVPPAADTLRVLPTIPGIPALRWDTTQGDTTARRPQP